MATGELKAEHGTDQKQRDGGLPLLAGHAEVDAGARPCCP
jgi:hypothetical protein